MINPQWLELPMSRTNFHGSKDVRAIEVRLYMFGLRRGPLPNQWHNLVKHINSRHILAITAMKQSSGSFSLRSTKSIIFLLIISEKKKTTKKKKKQKKKKKKRKLASELTGGLRVNAMTYLLVRNTVENFVYFIWISYRYIYGMGRYQWVYIKDTVQVRHKLFKLKWNFSKHQNERNQHKEMWIYKLAQRHEAQRVHW